jgi:integrase
MDSLLLFPPGDADAIQADLWAAFDAFVAKPPTPPSGRRRARPIGSESEAVYRDMWGQFARHCAHRGVTLDTVRPEDLENLLASLGRKIPGPDGKPAEREEVSDRYAWRLLSLVDRVSKYCAQRSGNSPNCAAEILLREPPYRYANAKQREPLPSYLTALQCRQLVRHVITRPPTTGIEPLGWKEVRNRTAVALQLGAGLSPQDVRVLELSHVIFAGANTGNLPWKLAVPGNGNYQEREAPIARWAARQLAFWLDVRASQRIGQQMVFPATRAGDPWQKRSVYAACEAVLSDADLGANASGEADDGGGSYRLRHTFAIRQLYAGHSDEQVAAWLGVQDLSVIGRYRRVILKPVKNLR